MIRSGIAGALIVLAALLTSAAGAQEATKPGTNVALGRPYVLAPTPNYDKALGPTGHELTDGKVETGAIWAKGGAVGWSWRGSAIIRITLAQIVTIDRVRFHTARSEAAKVYYPAQAFVFVGDGEGRYEYVGDAAGADPGNVAGPPEERNFELHFAARSAREVVLVLAPRGPLVVLDELEVIAASGAGSFAGRLALHELLSETQRLRRAFAVTRGGPPPTGPDPARRWAIPLGDGEAAGDPVCSVTAIDPWGAVVAGQEPALYAPAPRPLRTIATVDGRDYVAWRLVNRSGQPAQVRLSAPAGTGAATLAPLALAHVQALDYRWIADVVTPFDGVALPAGSAMILMAEVAGGRPGIHPIDLDIACGAAHLRERIEATVLAVSPAIPALHGTLWSYLHRPVTDALTCAPDLHARIGVDTAVVHPDALIDAAGGRPEQELRHYFRAFAADRRLLLFMDIRFRRWPFLDKDDRAAEAYLADWWAWVRRIAAQEKVAGELVLYPIDEIQPADVPRLERFKALAARAMPGVRLYGTFDKTGSAKALASFDIVQAHSNADVLELAIAARRPETHLYGTRSDGRLIPANAYYRLQGWHAYLKGLDGVGFWSLWESSGNDDPASGWNGFGGRDVDFGVLYAAPGGCAWPSRRLLAWRRGIEENRILRYCEAKLGRDAVRSVATLAVTRPTSSAMTADFAALVARCTP